MSEKEFIEQKYGDNDWKHYPPSKNLVACWLKEYASLKQSEWISVEDENRGADYYLVKTESGKWGIAYWDGAKFWDDEMQDGSLSFGIKREHIKEVYKLPTTK